MNKYLLRLLFVLPFLVFCFYSTSYSKDDFAPPMHTGASGEPSCGFSGTATNTCHGSTTTGPNASQLLSLNTDISLLADGNAVSSTFKYTPNQEYLMTFRINNPSSRNGFSLTVQKNSLGTFAGDITIPASSDAELSANDPEYVGHTNTLGVSQWTFNWLAPAPGNGDVTFYASANKGNNNNAASGDQIIPFKMEISENTSVGISNLNISNEISSMRNPILHNLVSFQVYVKEAKKYFISIYDFSGKRISYEERIFHVGLKDFEMPLDQKGIFVLNIRTNQNESASFKILNK